MSVVCWFVALLMLGSSSAQEGPLVVLDPGHGGTNTGAPGYREGLFEKRATLQLYFFAFFFFAQYAFIRFDTALFVAADILRRRFGVARVVPPVAPPRMPAARRRVSMSA